MDLTHEGRKSRVVCARMRKVVTEGQCYEDYVHNNAFKEIASECYACPAGASRRFLYATGKVPREEKLELLVDWWAGKAGAYTDV